MSCCRRKVIIFQKLLKRSRWMCRMSSTGAKDASSYAGTHSDRDPLPIFLDKRVQTLLKQMTGLDIAKVMSFHMVSEHKKPKITLVTDEQLEEMQLKTIQKAVHLLNMPPIMNAEEPMVNIYHRDPEIAEALTHKFVFTDVSMGVKDRDRLVAVRDKDGTLRPADCEEKRRVCQMFNPQPSRKLIMPKMFEPVHLEYLLNETNYRYILERACTQFEPDNADFIRVCSRVYDHINETRSFQVIKSTRFYGPMVFYLSWNRNVDLLLIDMLQNHMLEDAINLLELYQIIHPNVAFLQPDIITIKKDVYPDNEEVIFTEFGEVDREAMRKRDLRKVLNSDFLKNTKMEIKEVDKENVFDKEKIKKQLLALMKFSKQYARHQHAAELELTIQTYEDSLHQKETSEQSAEN